jgi:cytidylate kinase
MDNRETKGLVIAISGPHGTGKSTYAKALAHALKLQYLSAGELFRELAKERKMSLEDFSHLAEHDPSVDRMIDERTKMKAKEGSVVIDAQLAAWMLRDVADVKALLVAPDEVRFRRIAQREHISISAARKETLAREQIQKRRYKKYYGIDICDLSIYDLKIDTSVRTIEETKSILLEKVKNLLSRHRTKFVET